MDKKRIILINSSVILIILLAIFFIRPAYLGYATYKEMQGSDLSLEDYGKNMQELKNNMVAANTNLSVCYDFNQILIGQLEKSSDDLIVCNKQVTNYAVSEEKSNVKIDELEKEIEKKEDGLNQYKNEYNLLIGNLANKICCKMKIDNNKISYYKIENNNIICSEESGQEISCSFG